MTRASFSRNYAECRLALDTVSCPGKGARTHRKWRWPPQPVGSPNAGSLRFGTVRDFGGKRTVRGRLARPVPLGARRDQRGP